MARPLRTEFPRAVNHIVFQGAPERTSSWTPRRETFLSRARIRGRDYRIARPDPTVFTRHASLTEASSGLAPEGGGGFKTETYKIGQGPREGDIAEQSRLLGKVCAYTFDHGAIPQAIADPARQHGYTVHYHVTGL